MSSRRTRDRNAPAFRSRVPVLTSSFRYPGRSLFKGTARLFADRVELTEWSLRGRHCRHIDLPAIAYMDYGALDPAANLTLHLSSDEVVQLHMRDAHHWRDRFEDWYRYAVLPSAKMLSDVEAVAALAG